MVFYKTGWRIQHLVSHRKSNNLESSTESLEGHYLDSAASTNTSRRTSWLSQAPTETPTTRRTSTGGISNTRRGPSPLIGTAHSSASSLCSCDCGPKTPTIDLSLSKLELVEPTPEILYLPPLPSTTTSGDARAWRLIFSEQLSPPQRSSQPNFGEKRSPTLVSVPEVTFDLLEALEIEPVDHDKTPTPSITVMSDVDHPRINNHSNHVKQLIRTTDGGFQTAGAAEEDETTIAGPVTRTIAVPRGISKKQQNASSNTPVKTPISRSKSAAKTKRSVFYRKRIEQLSKVEPKVDASPSHTLWANVTTNMVDVLSGKMFRTEVDEMLTPSRMRQLRSSVKIDTQRKVSTESTQSIDTDCSTPTELFHLESLSARISAATAVSPVSPPTPSLPPLPAIPKDKRRENTPKVSLALPSGDPGMVYEDLTFPSPPPLPRRSSMRPKAHRAATLPTISESALLALPSIKLEPEPSSGTSTPNHATLRSTPFTLTSPVFRHGNIRLDRHEDAVPDETLDWTAFQMAISGTMDDEEAIERARDKAELEDLVQWWESFCLPLGEIIRETPKVQRMVVYVRDENNRETPWKGRSPEQLSAEGRTWGVKMEEQPDSMPPSPMVDLGASWDGKRYSVVPMGCNLGHDLGDFLSWEMQHVSVSGGLYDSERER